MFYKNGLSLFQNKQISILEIGFGTGLNAFITFGRKKESINRLRRVEASICGRTWFHELRRRIECLMIKVFLKNACWENFDFH
jgi:hypothetical protein